MKIISKSLSLVILLSLSLFSANISQAQCNKQGDKFIFAGGECIQFYKSDGEIENTITILVHGTWPEGTNILSRYSVFAQNLSMQTDITTIAVALPGYSKSSTNNFTALAHKGTKNLAAKKEYIEFLSDLVTALKKKYNAKTVNYIGHSAGAMMGATLTGVSPTLINNIALAGGRYDIHTKANSDNLVSIVDYMKVLNKKTNYLLIYGTKDTTSKPSVTKEFYQKAKKAKLSVKIVEVKDAVHLDLDMTDESVDAIIELLEIP